MQVSIRKNRVSLGPSHGKALIPRPIGTTPIRRLARSDVAPAEPAWELGLQTDPLPPHLEEKSARVSQPCLSPPLHSRYRDDQACARYDQIERSGFASPRRRISILV